MKYIIGKSSRNFKTLYTGITCDRAGVEPGKYYDTREEAELDADKLSKHNPVGFIVEEVEAPTGFDPVSLS